MSIENIIKEYACKDILVEGPIEVTEDSYPFDSMKHCRVPYDLGELGYCEEEYFISGFANVYDEDDSGNMIIKRSGLPYKTRVLVRKPLEREKFSGRVYLDILNETNGYDHEDLWTRIYDWCVKYGHGYIGITSKPISVLALKNFDYKRYKTLNWSNGIQEPQPVCCSYHNIPGTEEGLFWDMLSQTANRIKGKNINNFFNGWNVDWLYLTGQSQSGAYLNTYVKYFDRYLKREDGKHFFDGYMNIVGAFLERKLCQDDELKSLTFNYQSGFNSEIPFIKISCEGDFYLFEGFGMDKISKAHLPVNEDSKTNKSRYYEIAGSPHFDIKCPVIVSDQDVIKAGRKPHVIPDEGEQLINDFPLAYYIVALLEKLHIWAANGIAPEVFEGFQRDENGEIKRDDDGNVLGGMRSAFMDVPVASYEGCDLSAHLGVIGKMRYFSKEQIIKRYGSKEAYLALFNDYVEKEVKGGWLIHDDSIRVKKWAEDAINKIFS